jgi:acetyltransferase-like isoleucine patch superfamily enzyme
MNYRFKSHGNGKFKRKDFKKIGKKNVIFEPGVLVFNPENIEIGNNIYIGHGTILDANYRGKIIIKDGVWIGSQCFIHGPGEVEIGESVGMGPGVKIISSFHLGESIKKPIIDSEAAFKKVKINKGADIGINAIILPGVIIGQSAQIGAGAVVTKNIPDYEVWAGVPAKKLRKRNANKK